MENEGVKVSLSLEEWAELKKNVLHGKPYADRVSIGLTLRLIEGIQKRSVDLFAVLKEIDYLEGIGPVTPTKQEEPFRKPPLSPFWHKHFASALHAPRNIAERWGLKHGGNGDFDKMIHGVAKNYGDDVDVMSGQLANSFVMDGYQDRLKARRETGDWIVFAKHGGKNYYLDLAVHEEGIGEAASGLMRKLRNGSATEFPFLFDLAEHCAGSQ